MRLNNTFLLTRLLVFRTYKTSWFKFLLTFLGLILSLALMTTISLYVDLVRDSTDNQRNFFSLYPKRYVVHSTGNFTPSLIKDLQKRLGINRFYPYNDIIRVLPLRGKDTRLIIYGVDFFQFQDAFLSKDVQDQTDLRKMVFLLSPDPSHEGLAELELSKEQRIQCKTIITNSVPRPVIVMDIGYYEYLFQSTMIERFYIPDEVDVSLDLQESLGQWGYYFIDAEAGNDSTYLSSAFFLNLRLVGVLGMVISFLLLFKFFRFMFQQRQRSFSFLSQLGMRAGHRYAMFAVEVTLFIGVAVVSGVFLGYVFAYIGLDILAQTMRLLYVDAAFDSLQFNLSICIDALLITLVSVFAAMSNKMYRFLDIFSFRRWSISGIIGVVLLVQTYFFWKPYVSLQVIGYGLMMLLLMGLFFSVCLGIVQSIKMAQDVDWPSLYSFKTTAFHINRQRVETIMTIVAIGVACGLYITMALFIHSFQVEVQEWITSGTQSDYYVQSPHNSIPDPYPLPRNVLEYLEKNAAVEAIDTIRRSMLQVGEHQVMLVINPFDRLKESKRLDFLSVLDNWTWDDLDHKHIFISESYALKAGLNVGDQLDLKGTHNQELLTVMGVFKDYATEQGIVLVSNKLAQFLFGDLGPVHGVSFDVRTSSHQAFLDSFSVAFPDLLIQRNTELQDYVMQAFQQTFQLSWILSILAMALALFVFITMMSLIIQNRFPDFEQLYVLGASWKQLWEFLFVHTIWLGLKSCLAAFGFGLSFAYILLNYLTPTYFGWTISLDVISQPFYIIGGLLFALIVLASCIFLLGIRRRILTGGSLRESVQNYYFSS